MAAVNLIFLTVLYFRDLLTLNLTFINFDEYKIILITYNIHVYIFTSLYANNLSLINKWFSKLVEI